MFTCTKVPRSSEFVPKFGFSADSGREDGILQDRESVQGGRKDVRQAIL